MNYIDCLRGQINHGNRIPPFSLRPDKDVIVVSKRQRELRIHASTGEVYQCGDVPDVWTNTLSGMPRLLLIQFPDTLHEPPRHKECLVRCA